MDTSSLLFPCRSDRLRWDNFLTALLAETEQRVVEGPVIPSLDRKKFDMDLAALDFHEAVDVEPLLNWVVAQMEHGLVHVNHPRYLGLFNPAPSFPAQCADRIAAVFNPQLASATTSPAAVAIEAHVIRAIANRTGLGSDAAGHFTSGGSEANFTALVCALTQASPAFAELGSRAFSGPPVFYVSRDSHLAWVKIAHQAGIGRGAVRMVRTDGFGRMQLEALQTMIDSDLDSGFVPVMIAATAGTTNAGMIDPLEHCANIARAAKIWYHVDAAWGGALITSHRHRGLLAGIEQADSITIDAHKWFATTMGCGMFLIKNPALLSASFHVSASFMPSCAGDLDPYLTTVQWSRRFVGLRLFLSLAIAGWRGHAAHVERCIELTGLLTDRIQGRGWTVANASPLGVACMEPPPGMRPVREIVDRAVGSGGAWLSVACFEGRDVVRACVTHGETLPADILAVVDLLERACRDL